LKTFYSIIISFIEYKNILINSGEKTRINKFAACKTELIRMVNKNHKCYDNYSLLLTLKLIRRITTSHAKRDYTFSLFTPPQNGKGELIMGMLDNINDSITSHRIVDNNLKTNMMEIKDKYYNKEEMISYLKNGNIIYAAMQNGKFATKKWNHAIILYKFSFSLSLIVFRKKISELNSTCIKRD